MEQWEKSIALMPIFSDGMVLQRDTEYEIWGKAASDSVVVEIDGAEAEAAVVGGRFRAVLPPHEAGAGYVMTVRGGGETVTVADVCFGDVFLFSGQSNFELPCERVLDISAGELASSCYPDIREYKVAPSYRFDRPEDEVQPAAWKRARGRELYEMSAAAFFFARELHERHKVPIGVVLNAVGGSRIEAWLPNDEIEKLPGLKEKIAPFLAEGSLQSLLARQEEETKAWYHALRRDISLAEAPRSAKDFRVPGMTAGTELHGFSGSVWFYREARFDKAPEGEGLLYLGELMDSDTAYINGVKVGSTGYRYPPRKYRVPEGLLREGENLIAVRLVITKGAGGFIPEHPYYLEAGGVRVELSGTWKYTVETAANEAPDCVFPPSLPSGLFNSSLAPLAGLLFKGVFWYQGESDSYEAENYMNYAGKLKIMVECWRRTLRQNFGFVCVELADYTDPIAGILPGWSAVQKAQREAPLHIPCCEAVSARDLGEPFELHPQRKKDLGLRLAEAAERLMYRRQKQHIE